MIFSVTWGIELDAQSPKKAAELARHIQLDPSSIATVFIVMALDGSRKETIVDLKGGE